MWVTFKVFNEPISFFVSRNAHWIVHNVALYFERLQTIACWFKSKLNNRWCCCSI